MTVCQKESPGASGDFLRRKNARLPKPAQRLACAEFLKVRTNGLAKYYNISRPRGQGGIVAREATTFFVKSTIIGI